jgi:peptidoglycan/xylan/chitin deacetylase (PgdA/CDA1 family)
MAVVLMLATALSACATADSSTSADPSTPAGTVGSPAPSSAAPAVEQEPSATPTPNFRLPKPQPGRATAISRIKTKDPVVFLTIDDGGHEEPPTAAILRKEEVPITSFLTVELVDHDPDFYQRISRRDGQTIQAHTLTHPQLPLLGYDAQRQEICESKKVLTQWYGERPWMVRPPYGDYNDSTLVAADSCDLDYVVLWTVNMPEGGKGSFQYKTGDGFVPGDIILAHWRPDLHRDIKRALRDIRSQGFEVAALQDYLPRR